MQSLHIRTKKPKMNIDKLFKKSTVVLQQHLPTTENPTAQISPRGYYSTMDFGEAENPYQQYQPLSGLRIVSN